MMSKLLPLLCILIWVSPLFSQKELLRRMEMERYLRKAPQTVLQNTPNQSLYDVHMYILNLELLPDQQLLDGRVTVGATSLTAALDRVELDLHDNMQVMEVSSPNGPLDFEHRDDILAISLERPYASQENFEFEMVGDLLRGHCSKRFPCVHGFPQKTSVFPLHEIPFDKLE